MIDIRETHSSYKKRASQWQKIRDAVEGEDAIKEAAQTYLPQPSGQDAGEYARYKLRSSFYSVTERTIRSLNGLVYRRAPLVDLPDALQPIQTSGGYSLSVLMEEMTREVLTVGRYGLLLDYPESANSGSVPYIAPYFAEDIINWQESFENGVKAVSRVVLKEASDGECVYLELFLLDGAYTIRRWVAEKEGAEAVQAGEVVPVVNGSTLSYIPFFFVSPYDARPEVEKPPALDLVNMNLAHYRNSADYEQSLYLTAQPTPFIAGQLDETRKPTSIGAGSIWYLPAGSTAGMLEFKGAGIGAIQDAMEDKENRMAALGARMISEAKTRNESQETARMRSTSELSLLTNTVNSVEYAVVSILKMAAEWAAINPDDVRVEINRDWIDGRMGGYEMLQLVRSWQSGAISRQTLHENLQKGEIISGAIDYDEERERVESEMGGVF